MTTIPLAPSLAAWVEEAIWQARNLYAEAGEEFDPVFVKCAFEEALGVER